MEYQFEPDLQKISDAVMKAGYVLNSVGCITTHIKNERGEAINAYVEPISLEASLGNEKILVGFFPKHERQAKGIVIKSCSGSTKNLNELEANLAEAIIKYSCRN